MKFSLDKKDRYSVFQLDEENLNSLMAPNLKSEFVFLRNEGVKNLIFDLRNVHYVDSETIEKDGPASIADMDAILVPGGFGERGVEGMILTAQYARENDVPYLGICLGMQVAVIEYARHVAGLSEAK